MSLSDCIDIYNQSCRFTIYNTNLHFHALYPVNCAAAFMCKDMEDSDRERVVFQCRHAFLPLVNPLVSLVRIRFEKSLICLQSPQGFTGGEIQLLHCFLNFSLVVILCILIAAHV